MDSLLSRFCFPAFNLKESSKVDNLEDAIASLRSALTSVIYLAYTCQYVQRSLSILAAVLAKRFSTKGKRSVEASFQKLIRDLRDLLDPPKNVL